MQSDRELTALAAKAAGVCLHPEDQRKHSYGNWGCDTTCMACKEDPSDTSFAPLTDDGDALRLAVKLEIEVRGFNGSTHAGRTNKFWCTENWFPDGDIYAATRRAITRAAAQLAQAQEGK